MPNYLTELSPDNNTHVYQIKDKEAAPIDLLKDTVGWVGKNVFAYPYKSGTKTENGVTFTDNEDGSVTISIASGGATADSTFYFHDQTTGIRNSLLEVNKLILSGGISNNIYINVWNAKGDSASVASKGDEALVDFTNQNNDFNIILHVKSGTTLANAITIKPMFRKASIIDDTYEPYHPSVEDWYWENNAKTGAHNLMPILAKTSRTVQGVNYSYSNDTVSLSGTTSGTGWVWLNNDTNADASNIPFKKGAYRVKVIGTLVDEAYMIRIFDANNNRLYSSDSDGSEHEFTIASDINIRYGIYFKAASKVATSSFKIMICLAEDTCEEHTGYAMTNRELTEKVNSKNSSVSLLSQATQVDGTGKATFTISNITSYTDLIVEGYNGSDSGGNRFVVSIPTEIDGMYDISIPFVRKASEGIGYIIVRIASNVLSLTFKADTAGTAITTIYVNKIYGRLR